MTGTLAGASGASPRALLLVIGDSIGLGTGKFFPGAVVDAVVGIPSSKIVPKARPGFRNVLVSAGSNNITKATPAGAIALAKSALAADLARIRAACIDDHIPHFTWILPQFAAAAEVVIAFAKAHGDDTVAFVAGGDGIHPRNYPVVAAAASRTLVPLDAPAPPPAAIPVVVPAPVVVRGAHLDRDIFFPAVRKSLFGGILTQAQVDGFNTILDAAPPLLGTTSLAYCLATVFWECGRTMQPIEEIGRGRGKSYGASGFWGRGYVQLTWQASYAKATARLRQLGILRADEDLVKTPALAMRPDVAAPILFVGMAEGWFTGKKLEDYFGGGRYDAVGARRIINGTDRAAQIAGYCGLFVAALRAAGHSVIPGAVPSIDTPPLQKPTQNMPAAMPVAVQPAPSGGLSSAPAPAPRPGFFARLLSTIRTNMQKGA